MKQSTPILFLILLFPPVVYFLLIHLYMVNIPFEEDFYLLIFLDKYFQAEGVLDKLSAVFSQVFDHRQVIPNLILVFLTKLNSHLDFKTAVYVGNLALAGQLFLFYRLAPRGFNGLAVTVPAAFLLFSLQGWLNMTLAMSALMHGVVPLLSGLAFYFLGRPKPSDQWISFLFAALAAFTMAGGVFIFVAATIYFWLAGKLRERLLWVLAGSVVLFFFFMGYESPHSRPNYLEALWHPLTYFSFAFSYMGSSLSVDDHYFRTVALIGGILGFAWFCFLTWKKYYRMNPTVYCFMLYIILLGLALAMSRSTLGTIHAFSSSYKGMTASFLVLVYLSLLDWIPVEKQKLKTALVRYAAVLAAVIYFWSIPYHYYKFRTRTHWMAAQHSLWHRIARAPDKPYKHRDGRIMAWAFKNGIYKLPAKGWND